MKHLCVAALLSLFAASLALAQEGAACAAKDLGKDGKALAGTAKAQLNEEMLRNERHG
jgi:hypothetical protein